MRISLWESIDRPHTSTGRTIAIVTELALLMVMLSSGFQVTAAHAQTTMAGQQSGTTLRTQAQTGSVPRQDVFVRGADNALWHRWTDLNTGAQSSWESLGGHLDSAPAAVAGGSVPYGIDVVYLDHGDIQHVEVFTLSSQTSFHRENLGHIPANNNIPWWKIWGGFSSPVLLTSAPAIASWGSGRLDVFAFAGHGLEHKWYTTDDGWSKWEELSQSDFTDDPAAVSWGPGRIDVFVHGSTVNDLEDKVFDGHWHNWQPLGGILTSSPAATSTGSGQLNVFVRNPANGLSERTFSAGQWGAWSTIDSNTMSSAPTVAFEKGRGRTHVFARGPNGALWYNFNTIFNGVGYWAHWDPQNGPPIDNTITSAPAVTVGDLAYISSPPIPR